MFRYFHRRADMTRNPLLEEEENNRNGAAPLTDAEITEFTEAVVYSRSVIPDVPSVWLEGYKVAATFPHGLGMSISSFKAVIIAYYGVAETGTTLNRIPVQSSG